MSGETRERQSGWSVDTLNALIEKVLGERDMRYKADRIATEAALEAIGLDAQRIREIIEARLDGSDTAVALLAANVTRVPTDVDKQVGHLRELHDEKFRSLEQMISQRFLDNKLAVDAAFAAAKEAVGEQNKSIGLARDKSETTFTKQVESLGEVVDSRFRATDGQVDDLKASMAKLTTDVATLTQTVASNGVHRQEERTQQNWSTGVITASVISSLSLLVAIVVAVALIIHG
ncbi:MAG TPA: hypothetical protein VII58_02915 [Acidobacteriaceae bacterium]